MTADEPGFARPSPESVESPAPPDAAFDARLDRIYLVVATLGTVLAAGLASWPAALSVALGAALAWINFRWLKSVVNFAVSTGGKGPVGGRMAFQYVGRHVLIGLGLFATIRFTFLDATFLLAGLLSYVLAVLLECIFQIISALSPHRVDPDGRT